MASDAFPDVMVLLGSPRKGGNADALAGAFLEPAEDRDLSIERVRIADLDFEPCRGCHACEGRGECIQKDAMQDLYPKLLHARWILLASPVFFYNVPGKTKSFIDRAQALWARKYTPPGGEKGPVPISEPGRKGFAVACGATKGKNLFKGLEWTVRYFFDAIDVSHEGLYGVRGLEDKGDAAKKPGALDGAREAGRAFFME